MKRKKYKLIYMTTRIIRVRLKRCYPNHKGRCSNGKLATRIIRVREETSYPNHKGRCSKMVFSYPNHQGKRGKPYPKHQGKGLLINFLNSFYIEMNFFQRNFFRGHKSLLKGESIELQTLSQDLPHIVRFKERNHMFVSSIF